MKHHDLWNDTANDLLPPGTLAVMQREARRLRVQRRVVRASAVAAVLALGTWLTFRSSTPPPSPNMSIAPQTAPAVRYLDDAAFIQRLNAAGIGIAIGSAGDEKQLLLVSNDGQVYRP